METDEAATATTTPRQHVDNVLFNFYIVWSCSWILHVVCYKYSQVYLPHMVLIIDFRFPQILSLYYKNKELSITTCSAVHMGYDSLLQMATVRAGQINELVI